MTNVLAQQNQIDWTPYENQGQAVFCLTRFVNAAFSNKVGIIWCSTDVCTLIRPPGYDQDGFGQSIVFQWVPNPPPPPPLAKLGFWQKLEKLFEDSMAAQGEAMLVQGAVAQAQGQAVLDWLSNKDNEHKIGIALDVLGIVNFFIMCIPVVGEADMGLMAVGAAAREVFLTRTGMFATAVAGGAALGATVDGRYLQLRYMSDGDAQERVEKAEKWDDSKLATGMSIAAAILTMADFGIGGVLSIRDLRNMSKETKEMVELSKSAAESRESAASLKPKLDYMQATHPNKTATRELTQRSQSLAQKAKRADRNAFYMAVRLKSLLYLGAPLQAVGDPVVLGYFSHDNKKLFNDPKGWIGELLAPPKADARLMKAGHIGAQTAVSTKPGH